MWYLYIWLQEKLETILEKYVSVLNAKTELQIIKTLVRWQMFFGPSWC